MHFSLPAQLALVIGLATAAWRFVVNAAAGRYYADSSGQHFDDAGDLAGRALLD